MEKALKANDFRFFIGCPCQILGIDKPIISTIKHIDVLKNKIICIGNEMHLLSVVEFDPENVKPILRKFDMLSRHEIEELNKLWPKENIKRTIYDSIVLDANIINYLTSLNVDVFGWIEKGLAIDAEYNTLNSI